MINLPRLSIKRCSVARVWKQGILGTFSRSLLWLITIIICIIIILKIGFKHFSPVTVAIYRKKKFTSPKKVGGPEIGAAHKSQKVARPAQ